MTAEEKERIRTLVHGIGIAAITLPSARDEQMAPGPSDLANKCDVCVAKKIADSLGVGTHALNDDFSLKAWLGTAAHEKLERDLKRVYPNAEQEITVEIGMLPKVGLIEGHMDVFVPEIRTCVDWKTTDMEKLKGYKAEVDSSTRTQRLTAKQQTDLEDYKTRDRAGLLHPEEIANLIDLTNLGEGGSGGVPEEHLGQTMLYLYGLRRMGRDAEYAALFYIPRDSNNVSDIWVAVCEYQSDVAEEVLRRANRLAEFVLTGNLKDLTPHSKCWSCVIRPRMRRRS